MDTRIPPTRPDVVTVTSEPRPTPTPPHAQFGEVLSRTAKSFVRGAEMAITTLPGVPLMAAAVRGGGAMTYASGYNTSLGSGSGSALTSTAEGPSAVGGGGVVGGAGVGGSPDGGGGIEASLAQSQEMSLYFLRIQEEVNAQNRTFSALSNVLKTEHETVKTAIGNLR